MKTMRSMMLPLVLFFISWFVLPLSSSAGTNLIFILDGSNSMWGQVDGVAKIETAQAALTNLVNEIPNETHVGLMSYGLFSKDSCDDVHYLVTTNENNRKKISKFVTEIQPKGKTPIAKSLAMAGERFRLFKEDDNHIVLISDGIESCGGDPCAVAAQLREKGINVRVHVVGFDVGDEADKQLACIASVGGGKYFQANSTEGFKEAIAEVNKEVQIVETPPKPTGPKEVFRDDFNGDELGEHWEIINPNPDSFIVENGVLTILASGNKPLIGSDELENIFRLTKGLPKGDWTATIRFKPEIATFRERYILALYKDKDNMLIATAGNDVGGGNNAIILSLWGDKVSRATKTGFSKPVLRSPGIGYFQAAIHNYTSWTSANEKAILMRIEKASRNYIISSKIEGDLTMADGKEPQWVELQKLTSLRTPGDSLVIALTQKPFGGNRDYQVSGGEALIEVDWIKIEIPE